MKKGLGFALISLLFVFILFSCAETRRFEHTYKYVPVDENGHIILDGGTDEDGNKTFTWESIMISFSGGDDLYWYYDKSAKQKRIVAKYKGDGKEIKPFSLEENIKIVENSNASGANYSIDGKTGQRFKIPSWMVVKDGKLVEYNGTGCENLTFWAAYQEE